MEKQPSSDQPPDPSRRRFIKAVGGAGIAGLVAGMELQKADEGVQARRLQEELLRTRRKSVPPATGPQSDSQYDSPDSYDSAPGQDMEQISEHVSVQRGFRELLASDPKTFQFDPAAGSFYIRAPSGDEIFGWRFDQELGHHVSFSFTSEKNAIVIQHVEKDGTSGVILITRDIVGAFTINDGKGRDIR